MNNDLQRDILRPRAVIERLEAEGIGGLTEYSLYLLLKRGEIPSRKPGRCYLVSYRAVLDYLRCADGGDIIPPPPVAAGEYRRVGL